MNIINVGTENPSKVQAVEEVLLDYPFLKPFKVVPMKVLSGVSEQPKSTEEIVSGAINRACNSFNNCKYSIGIESGLISIPGQRYFDVTFCSIYDGVNSSLGLSCGFEIPAKLIELIFKKGMNLTQASHHSGLTENPNINIAEGLIGLLTKNKVTRKDYTKQAIRMALIQIENSDLYHS